MSGLTELRTVLPYFRPYRRRVMTGLAFVLLANVFQVVGPWLMKLAIDGLDDPDVSAGRIAGLAGLIVAAAVLGGGARFGMRQLLNSVSRRMETDLRNAFFRHLLRLDATYYGGVRTGDLMSRATNDTLAVRMAVGPAVMYSANTVMSFLFAMSLMLLISPRLTLLAMVPMVVLPPLVLLFGRVIHRRFEEIQEQFSTLSTMVQENLTGVRIVRAYTQEETQARHFDNLNEEYRQRNMRLVLSAGAFHPVLMLIAGVAMVVVLWLGGIEVIEGRISVGDFVAFGFYLSLLIWPMIALGWVVNLFERGAASMGRLNRVFSASPATAVPKTPQALPEVRGDVEFRDVTFRYPSSDRPVLDGVSFEVRAGQRVAVVGPTGAGKSTLIALLARIYDPASGDILVDGHPTTTLDPSELRRVIGMVPQDAFLFSETLEQNIALGLGEATLDGSEVGGASMRAAVVQAAGAAQLHEQVEAFPQGYATLLGERGINLSGGQKQRATLARALARDPAILLLDDALSAVDTHTEARILQDLQAVMAGRTSFIVSHRVSAVMDADLILVLEDGRIVERGLHADLIGAGGTYARLLERQMLEESLAGPTAR